MRPAVPVRHAHQLLRMTEPSAPGNRAHPEQPTPPERSSWWLALFAIPGPVLRRPCAPHRRRDQLRRRAGRRRDRPSRSRPQLAKAVQEVLLSRPRRHAVVSTASGTCRRAWPGTGWHSSQGRSTSKEVGRPTASRVAPRVSIGSANPPLTLPLILAGVVAVLATRLASSGSLPNS